MRLLSPASFLQTRVARRVLGLFVVCALVPVVALAAIAYRQVTSELENQARQRLRDESKATGAILFDRIAGLADALNIEGRRTGRFTSLALERPGRPIEPLLGEIGPIPPLDSKQLLHLAHDGVALVAVPSADSARIFLVRDVAGPDGVTLRLWGAVSGETMWSRRADRSPAPPGMQLCLLTATGEPLSCSPRPAAAELGRLVGRGTGTFTWQQGNERHLAGYWNLFLGRPFAAPPWTVILSLPESSVLAPLASFRRTFALAVALALVVVFVLSHVQIRRSLTPLQELDVATRRIARGDFAGTVDVRSGDEFAALAGSFNQMSGALHRQFATLAALHEIDRAALSAEAAEPVLHTFLARARLILGCDAVVVALADPDDATRWSVTVQAAAEATPAEHQIRPSPEELAELAASPDELRADSAQPTRSYLASLGSSRDRALVALPLLKGRKPYGVLAFGWTRSSEPSPAERRQARQLADQLALVLSNAFHVRELDRLSWGALTALARTIDAVSPWTAGHSERVTRVALEIGRRLELPSDDLTLIHRGGLLHDIGKVGVPVAILDKPARLTDEEMRIVQQHPAMGARILMPIRAFRDAIPLVLHHHEQLDGTGYPDGLRGEAIPLAVRILTVADIYDALVSDRPYREGWPSERALMLLQEGAGTKFDSRAVTALADALATGWTVEQPNDGAVAPRLSELAAAP